MGQEMGALMMFALVSVIAVGSVAYFYVQDKKAGKRKKHQPRG